MYYATTTAAVEQGCTSVCDMILYKMNVYQRGKLYALRSQYSRGHQHTSDGNSRRTQNKTMASSKTFFLNQRTRGEGGSIYANVPVARKNTRTIFHYGVFTDENNYVISGQIEKKREKKPCKWHEGSS